MRKNGFECLRLPGFVTKIWIKSMTCPACVKGKEHSVTLKVARTARVTSGNRVTEDKCLFFQSLSLKPVRRTRVMDKEARDALE